MPRETFTPALKSPVTDQKLRALEVKAGELPVPRPFGTFPGDTQAERESYYRDFWSIFVSSTNEEKAVAEYLSRRVLPNIRRRHMLDVGVGDRRLARMVGRHFESFTGVEINPRMADRFRGQGKGGFMTPTGKDGFRIIRGDFMDAALPEGVDFALASHVLYYIPPDKWVDSAERLYRTLDGSGLAAIVLSGDEGDKAKLLRRFGGRTPPIPALVDGCEKSLGKECVDVVSINSHIRAGGPKAMAQIAGFLLRDGETTAEGGELASYVDENFLRGDGTYRMDTVQKMILLGRRETLGKIASA